MKFFRLKGFFNISATLFGNISFCHFVWKYQKVFVSLPNEI